MVATAARPSDPTLADHPLITAPEEWRAVALIELMVRRASAYEATRSAARLIHLLRVSQRHNGPLAGYVDNND